MNRRMEKRPANANLLVGLLRPLDHCLFTWQQPEGGPRSVTILTSHCEECIEAVRQLGIQMAPALDEDEE